MITQDQYDELRKPASARAFLYICPDDGTQEVMMPEGGEFELIECDEPVVYPLAGGLMTGRKLPEAALAAVRAAE